MRRTSLVFAAVVGLAAVALATPKDKDKLEIKAEKQGDLEVLTVSPKGRALLHMPPGIEGGTTKPGLLVTLHGAGSKADNMVLRQIAARRKWAVVAVEARSDVKTDQGVGHMWDGADAAYICAVAKWCVENRGIDATKVVSFGHSAGGTMGLESYAADPSVWAGVITCSAPMTPDKRHEDTRVVVFLGTKDPNFSGAQTVRSRMKKESGHLQLAVLGGAEHNDIPDTPYLDLAVDWVLATKAAGHEIQVPQKPPAEPAAGLRHVLFRFKGAKDATKDVKRSKDAAIAAANDVLKRVRAGKALFSHEAQALSEDADSAPLGGAIDAARLTGFGGALAEFADAPAGKDAFAGPFESEFGVHVVERVP